MDALIGCSAALHQGNRHGPRSPVSDQVFTDRQLRGRMTVKEHGFLSFITGSGKIDSVKLDEDILTIERMYQDRGYIYARVLDYERVRVDDKKVDLIFHIEEGQPYTVSSVSIIGNEVMTLEQLQPLLVTQSGQPYSATNIEKDEEKLKNLYGSQGYADSRVDVSITEAGADGLNVIYEVIEGEISYLGRLSFSGNDTTQDKVLRREFPIAPGDKMNRPALEAGKRRLQSLDYFESVDFSTAPSSIPGHKDVQINVKEKSTGSVNFGIGFSSIDNLVGFVDLTQSNFDLFDWPRFNGAGQKFRFGLKIGTERRDVIVSLTEPYMFGRRLSGTVEGYYRDLLFLSDFYDQTEYGGKFSLRKALGENAFFRVGYTIQNIDIQVDNDASDTIKAEEGEYLQSEINMALVHDTRDNIFLPRSGHRVEVGGRYSGEFLGGDVDLYGVHVSAVQHVSLPFDTIFTVKGRINVVESTGDDIVPIFDRQFLGGLRDLRGYEYREAGPKDELGEPIGGNTSAFATAEYTFPIMKKVRGAIFGDVGVVSEDSFDFGGDVFSDVGVGIRVYTGLGLISIDVAYPLKTDEFIDDELQFQFRMGYDFAP